jgi:hypothetical protein
LDGSRLPLDSFQCRSFLLMPSASTLCVPNGTHQFFFPFFFWWGCDDRSFLREDVQNCQMAPISPLQIGSKTRDQLVVELAILCVQKQTWVFIGCDLSVLETRMFENECSGIVPTLFPNPHHRICSSFRCHATLRKLAAPSEAHSAVEQ